MDDLFEQLKAAPPVNKNIVPKYATSDDYSKNIFRDDDDTPPPKQSTFSPVPMTTGLYKIPNSSSPKCIIQTRSFKVRIARIPKNWSVKIDKSVETKATNMEILRNKPETNKRSLDPKVAKKSQERETAINTKSQDSEEDDIKDSSNNVSDDSKQTLGSKATVKKNVLGATVAVKQKPLEKETADNTKPVETENADNKNSFNNIFNDSDELLENKVANKKSENEAVVNTNPVETEIAANMESPQILSDNNKKSMKAKAVANKKISEPAAAALKKSLEKEAEVNPNPVETGKGDDNESIKSRADYTEKPLLTKVGINKDGVETTVADNNIVLENETVVSAKAVKTATAVNMEVLQGKSSNNKKPIGPKTALNRKKRSSALSKRTSHEKESIANTKSVETEEVGNEESLNSSSDELVKPLENKAPVNKNGLESVTLDDEDSEEVFNRNVVENKVTDNMEPMKNKSDCNQSPLEAKVAVKRKARETTLAIKRNSLEKETTVNTKPLGKEEAGMERLENKSEHGEKALEKEKVAIKTPAETEEAECTEPIETKAADGINQIESNEKEKLELIDSEEIGNDETPLTANIKSNNESSEGVKQDMNNETDPKISVKPLQKLGKSDSKATPTKAQQKEFSSVAPIERTKAEKFLKPSNATKRCLVRLARASQWVNRVKSEQDTLAKTSQQGKVEKTSNQVKLEKTPKRKSAGGKGSQTAKRGRSSVSPTKPQTTFYIKLDTSPSRTLVSKREKSPEKSSPINKGPKSKIQNKRESEGLIKNLKKSPANKTKITKFSRTQLIKTFGKRLFQLHVRIKRCRHPVMVDFDTIAQARKKSKKLSVSFRDQVEILGSTDTDEQSDEDNLKGISKMFNSKKFDTEDSQNITPARLKNDEFSVAVEEGDCDQSLVNPTEVNTVDNILITTSTPLTHSSPSQKRKDKKSFSPLKFETAPSPKKEELKKANEKLPPSGLRLLNIDDIEDDDDECEYIVPTELPERRKSGLNSTSTTESPQQLELITKAEDSCTKSDEQKSSDLAVAEKHLINDTVIDVTDNVSDDDGEKAESVCIIEDDSDTEILPKLTIIPSSPNSILIPDSIPEIFSENEKSGEEETVAKTKDETDDIIQNILKERIDDLSLDDYGVADSVEQDAA